MHTTMTTVDNDRKLVILHLIEFKFLRAFSYMHSWNHTFFLKQKLVLNTVMYVYKYMYVCM